MPIERPIEEQIAVLQRKVPALAAKIEMIKAFSDSIGTADGPERFDLTKVIGNPFEINRRRSAGATVKEVIEHKTIPALELYHNLYGFKLRLLEVQLQGVTYEKSLPELLQVARDYFVIQRSNRFPDQQKQISQQNAFKTLGPQAFALLKEQEPVIVIDAQDWIEHIRTVPLQLSEEELDKLKKQPLPYFVIVNQKLMHWSIREIELLRLPTSVKNSLIRNSFQNIRKIDEAGDQDLLEEVTPFGQKSLASVRSAILEFKAKLNRCKQQT